MFHKEGRGWLTIMMIDIDLERKGTTYRRPGYSTRTCTVGDTDTGSRQGTAICHRAEHTSPSLAAGNLSDQRFPPRITSIASHPAHPRFPAESRVDGPQLTTKWAGTYRDTCVSVPSTANGHVPPGAPRPLTPVPLGGMLRLGLLGLARNRK